MQVPIFSQRILLSLPGLHNLISNHPPLIPQRKENLKNHTKKSALSSIISNQTPQSTPTLLRKRRKTHPIPNHQLHKRPAKHPTIAQIRSHPRRSPQHPPLFAKVRVSRQSKQDREADGDVSQPVFEGRQGGERGCCEVCETQEDEQHGDEGGGFGGGVHCCYVRLWGLVSTALGLL